MDTNNLQNYTEDPIERVIVQAHRTKSLTVVVVWVSVVIMVILGGIVYVYGQQMGLFSFSAPYSTDSFMSDVARSMRSVDTEHYSVSVLFETATRDATATPFVIKSIHTPEEIAQYKNDARRSKDISGLTENLRSYFRTHKIFPTTLTQLPERDVFNDVISTIDPLTKQSYQYQRVASGKDYTLTATFETQKVIDTYQDMEKTVAKFQTTLANSKNKSLTGVIGEVPTSTKINGKTITFTKDSLSYINFPPEPSKTPDEQASDMLSMIGKDFSFTLSASGTARFDQSKSVDQSNQIRLVGNFGDLAFIVDLESLIKDGIYYIRVNNIPNFLGLDVSSFKGRWIKFDSNDSTINASSSSLFGLNISEMLKKALSQQQKDHAAKQDAYMRLMEYVAKSKAVTVNGQPRLEIINGEKMYRYDLVAQIDGIRALVKSITTDATLLSEMQISTSTIENTNNYIQSAEFDQLIDYYQHNAMLSLWVDSSGRPRHSVWYVRYVPANAKNTYNKEVVVQVSLDQDHINEPIHIDTPTDIVSLDNVLKQLLKKSEVPNPKESLY